MSSWWERFPGRLEFELQDFRARGLDFERDDTLFRAAGRVLLRGSLVHGGRTIDLEVLYPDLFPYLRPEVYAPGLSLERHQNPAAHNLCLLDRSSGAWRPEETAAWLVAERVPLLLGYFDAGAEAMKAGEVPQGEPVSAYFPGIDGTVVFVPASALEVEPGSRVGSGTLWFAPDAPPQLGLRALLGELVVRPRAHKAKVVARADDALARRFGGQRIQMRWARLDAAPHKFDAGGILAAADREQSGFGRPPWQSARDGEIGVTGVVFPEEVRQGEIEDAWLFAVRWRRTAGGQRQQGEYVARGQRLTSRALGERIPHVAPLRDAVVAQVGAGALGAPLALELARNQVGELRLLDDDLVEASQTVRWPFGIEAVAHHKVETLARFIELNYPFTSMERFPHRLGQTAIERHGRTENEISVVERFLAGASLVVDASAEIGVQQLISDFAREVGVPQVFVSATPGARGGHVALIRPGTGACWHCWKRHTLEGSLPLPPIEEDGVVQPPGCASPTFTGASFDLLPPTAQAARVAAAAISAEGDGDSVVWVCAVPPNGFDAPEWSTHPIRTFQDCPVCGAAP